MLYSNYIFRKGKNKSVFILALDDNTFLIENNHYIFWYYNKFPILNDEGYVINSSSILKIFKKNYDLSKITNIFKNKLSDLENNLDILNNDSFVVILPYLINIKVIDIRYFGNSLF